MSVMNKLEKLSYFGSKSIELAKKNTDLMNEAKQLDTEFQTWLKKELGLADGKEFHMSEILKLLLEKSIDVKKPN